MSTEKFQIFSTNMLLFQKNLTSVFCTVSNTICYLEVTCFVQQSVFSLKIVMIGTLCLEYKNTFNIILLYPKYKKICNNVIILVLQR